MNFGATIEKPDIRTLQIQNDYSNVPQQMEKMKKELRNLELFHCSVNFAPSPLLTMVIFPNFHLNLCTACLH